VLQIRSAIETKQCSTVSKSDVIMCHLIVSPTCLLSHRASTWDDGRRKDDDECHGLLCFLNNKGLQLVVFLLILLISVYRHFVVLTL